MNDTTRALEDIRRQVTSTPDAFERLTRRRDRSRRNQRISAAVVALAIAAASLIGLAYAFRAVDRQRPANTSSWSRIPADPKVFGSVSVKAVTAGGPGFVAVGEDDSGTSPAGSTVWLSSDGTSWSRIPIDGSPRGAVSLSGVASGASGTLVAVGQDSENEPAAWFSADGTTWRRANVRLPAIGGDADGMFTVVPDGVGFIATGRSGDGGYLWRSADGTSWEPIPDESVFGGPGDQGLGTVVRGGPGFVIGGYDRPPGDAYQGSAAVWTSTDGASWTRVAEQSGVFASGGFTSMQVVFAGGPGLIGMGSSDLLLANQGNTAVWTSPDGANWSRAPDQASLAGASISAVEPSGQGFVAVGYIRTGKRRTGVVWTSADGLTWDRVDAGDAFASFASASGGDVYVEGLASSPSGLVAVGGDVYVTPGGSAVYVGAIWTTADVPEAAAPALPSEIPPPPDPCRFDTPSESGSTSDPLARVVVRSDSLTLCGSWGFDFDSGTTSGEGGLGQDVWFEDGNSIVTGDSAGGFPLSAAVNLGVVDFDSLSLSDLRSLAYGPDPIGGYDVTNPFVVGDVFAIRTDEGNYAKVQVLRFGTRVMDIRYVTYEGSG